MKLESLRLLEAAAYPVHMQSLQDCMTMGDVAEYAECKPKHLRILGEEGRWYAIVALHGRRAEFVDIAKMPGTVTVPWRRVMATIREWRVRELVLDARASTSYRIVRRLVELMGGTVVRDEAWDWDGETMHEMCIRLPVGGGR